jgi:hypothetical protein
MRFPSGVFLVLLVVAACTDEEDPPALDTTTAMTAFSCPMGLRFHFVRLHQDNGTGGANFSKSDLLAWVAGANVTFGQAGLNFGFNPDLDVEDLNSTLLLNNLSQYYRSGQQQQDAHALATQLAAERPGKIVVFLRAPSNSDYAAPPVLGPVPPDTGWPYSLDYVSLGVGPGPLNTSEAGKKHFAHELGHYLGLYHTQPSDGGLDPAGAANRAQVAHDSCTNDSACAPGRRCVEGWCRDTFDGDLIADTEEDPSPGAWTQGCDTSTMTCSEAFSPTSCVTCTTFAGAMTSRVVTNISCTGLDPTECGSGKGQCAEPWPGYGRYCVFTLTPNLTNTMSYYGLSPGAVVSPTDITAGQRSRVQDVITNIPNRNLLCNVPCWPDFHGLPIGSAETCLDYWKYREGMGPKALTVSWNKTWVAGKLVPGARTVTPPVVLERCDGVDNDGDAVVDEGCPFAWAMSSWAFFGSQTQFQSRAFDFASAGTALHHYNLRLPDVDYGAFTVLPAAVDSRPAPAVDVVFGMSTSSFDSTWAQKFSAGKMLLDVSVTNANPLTFTGVWACRGPTPPFEGQSCSSSAPGFTSATYYGLPNAQAVKNDSDSFFGNGIRLDRAVPYAAGTGHNYIANWNHSSALRGLFEASFAQHQGLWSVLSGLGYSVHDIEAFENDGIASVWRAPHNECHVGKKLHHDTDNCIAAVCSADSYCCNNWWDSICVSEVTSRCTPSRSCPANLRRPHGDFNEDGVAVPALWRASTGQWLVAKARTADPIWGQSGDVPLAADYNSDGVSDIVVWRPSTGNFMVKDGVTTQWGVPTDKPVVGDWTGDGVDDFAIWRPSDGRWWVKDGVTLQVVQNPGQQWGQAGDVPVPGDYNNDGFTDYAVWRPSTGQWFVLNQFTASIGATGDVPVPGDYDGNGSTDVAVWHPSTGNWEVNGQFVQQWGTNGDIPVPGDYNGDGRYDLVVFRPSAHHFFVKLNLSPTSFTPVNGTWLGAATDTPVLRASP